MNAETYAEALWRVISKGTAPKKAVAGLHDVLNRHGRTALLPRVARAFARIAARERRRNDVTLCVSRDADARTARKEIADIARDLGLKSGDISTRIDTDLIGGWRFEGRERLIDASFRKQLLSIYERVTRS